MKHGGKQGLGWRQVPRLLQSVADTESTGRAGKPTWGAGHRAKRTRGSVLGEGQHGCHAPECPIAHPTRHVRWGKLSLWLHKQDRPYTPGSGSLVPSQHPDLTTTPPHDSVCPSSHACAIPTGRLQPSMNLSHAVAVVLAELYGRRSGALVLQPPAPPVDAAVPVPGLPTRSPLEPHLQRHSTPGALRPGGGDGDGGEEAAAAAAQLRGGVQAGELGTAFFGGGTRALGFNPWQEPPPPPQQQQQQEPAAPDSSSGQQLPYPQQAYPQLQQGPAQQPAASQREVDLLVAKVAAVAAAVGMRAEEGTGGGSKGREGRRAGGRLRGAGGVAAGGGRGALGIWFCYVRHGCGLWQNRSVGRSDLLATSAVRPGASGDRCPGRSPAMYHVWCSSNVPTDIRLRAPAGNHCRRRLCVSVWGTSMLRTASALSFRVQHRSPLVRSSFRRIHMWPGHRGPYCHSHVPFALHSCPHIGNHGRRRLPVGHVRAVVGRARLTAGESRSLHGLASAVLQRVDPEHPLEAQKRERKQRQQRQQQQQQRQQGEHAHGMQGQQEKELVQGQ